MHPAYFFTGWLIVQYSQTAAPSGIGSISCLQIFVKEIIPKVTAENSAITKHHQTDSTDLNTRASTRAAGSSTPSWRSMDINMLLIPYPIAWKVTDIVIDAAADRKMQRNNSECRNSFSGNIPLGVEEGNDLLWEQLEEQRADAHNNRSYA